MKTLKAVGKNRLFICIAAAAIVTQSPMVGIASESNACGDLVLSESNPCESGETPPEASLPDGPLTATIERIPNTCRYAPAKIKIGVSLSNLGDCDHPENGTWTLIEATYCSNDYGPKFSLGYSGLGCLWDHNDTDTGEIILTGSFGGSVGDIIEGCRLGPPPAGSVVINARVYHNGSSTPAYCVGDMGVDGPFLWLEVGSVGFHFKFDPGEIGEWEMIHCQKCIDCCKDSSPTPPQQSITDPSDGGEDCEGAGDGNNFGFGAGCSTCVGGSGLNLKSGPVDLRYTVGAFGAGGGGGQGDHTSHNQTARWIDSTSKAEVGLEGMSQRFEINNDTSNKPDGWTFSQSLNGGTMTISITDTVSKTYTYSGYSSGFTQTSDWDGREIPLVEVTEPGGVTRRYEWITSYNTAVTDDYFLLTKQKTPDGNHYITYDYNADNLLTKLTHDAGREISLEYDYNDNTRLTKVLHGCSSCGGISHSYVYDIRGRISQRSVPGSGLKTFSYSGNNLLTKVERGTSNSPIVTWEYGDGFLVTRRKLAVNDSGDERYTDYELGDHGVVTKRIEYTGLNGTGTGCTTEYKYLCDGSELTKEATYSPGGVTHYTYYGATSSDDGVVTKRTVDDGTGNEIILEQGVGSSVNGVPFLTMSINEYGGTTEYAYDNNWLLTAQTMAAPYSGAARQVYYYAYDDTCRLTREIHTDTSGSSSLTKRYYYDLSGQLTRQVEGAGNLWAHTRYEYDDYGALVVTVDARGNARERMYSPSGALTSEVVYQIGSSGDVLSQTSYEYDGNGRMTLKLVADDDEPFTVDSPSSWITTSYAYDEYGRKTQTIEDVGGLNLTTRYEYNNQDELVKTTTPGGVWTETRRDGRGLVTMQIMGYDTDPNHQLTTTYEYDVDGNLTKTTNPQGVETWYEYDGYGRKTRMIQE